MSPAFDLQGGLPLALARGASVAALLSALGALVFRTLVAPPTFPLMPAETARRIKRRLLLLTQVAVAASGAALLVWLVLQAGDMAGAGSAAQAMAVVPLVLSRTEFGRLVMLQLVGLLAVGLVLGRREHPVRQRVALGLAAFATLLQTGHSHAASMYAGPSLLLASDVLHLLAAGAWLGGLLPLLLLVRAAPTAAGAAATFRFSPLGKLCVSALAVTAGYQSWVLVSSVPGLVGTGYGRMALVKLSLFAALVALAAVNRYRLSPALLREDAAAAKRALLRNIAVEAGIGLAVVLAAAVLSGLPPAMHVQPLWPFGDRFTLDTIREDPDFRNEVVGAVLALAAAVLLPILVLLLRRRLRQAIWPALGGAAVIAWFAIPHLDLLFVPAYPTTYYRSPTGFAATAIVRGAALFQGSCAVCHGASGSGDGPAAKTLPVPPADLTAPHLWMHRDGELFWWISHGIEAPEGGPAMPGFAGALSEEERWDLIDYIRAHNAGLVFHRTGAWSPPLRAPGLQADCTGGRSRSLEDFRGGFVRLVLGSAPAVPGATTILAATAAAARPAAGLCIARDETLPHAYAIVSGLAEAELPGAQFLIDGDGWLRAVEPAGTTPGWNDPTTLSAEIGRLKAHPLAAAPPMPMNMPM